MSVIYFKDLTIEGVFICWLNWSARKWLILLFFFVFVLLLLSVLLQSETALRYQKASWTSHQLVTSSRWCCCGHHGRRVVPPVWSSEAVWCVRDGINLQGGAGLLQPAVWPSGARPWRRGAATVPANQTPPQLLEGQRSVGQTRPKSKSAGVPKGGQSLQQHHCMFLYIYLYTYIIGLLTLTC